MKERIMDINNLLHRKESIILATIDVIDEFGFRGLSTREVAKRVGISEPAIFKHFKTKGELILAVVEHFSQYDSDVIQSIRAKKLEPVKAIICFIETYATYYENYPAITAITQNFDLLRTDPNLSDKIQNIVTTRTSFITEMARQASSGKVNTDQFCENLGVTIMGLTREWCLLWRLSGYNFSLKERMVSNLNMILEAFHLKDNEL
jgi:AcrR family transcriptional regulator